MPCYTRESFSLLSTPGTRDSLFISTLALMAGGLLRTDLHSTELVIGLALAVAMRGDNFPPMRLVSESAVLGVYNAEWSHKQIAICSKLWHCEYIEHLTEQFMGRFSMASPTMYPCTRIVVGLKFHEQEKFAPPSGGGLLLLIACLASFGFSSPLSLLFLAFLSREISESRR